MWTNDTGDAIYADNQGNVVPFDHPDVAVMVVGAKGQIPEKVARQYGLVEQAAGKAEVAAPSEEPSVETPPTPAKAASKPTGTKAARRATGKK